MKQTTNFQLNKPDTTDYYNILDSNNNMDIIDAEIKEAQEKAENPPKVNGHTIESDVPIGAIFTDTTYSPATQTINGLMSSVDKKKLDGVADGANKYFHPESGVIAGTYKKVTVNALGHVTAGNNDAVSISEGGTGANNTVDALKNLGLIATAAELNYLKGVTDLVQTQLNSRATKSTIQNVSLTSSSWSGSSAPYTYVITVTGVTASNVIELVPQNNLTTEQAAAMVNAQILTGTQSTNSLTLKAYGSKPSLDLPITLIIRGDV